MPKQQKVELWIKLSLPGTGQVGPGKMHLLRLIDEHQSIAAAARAMGMSYRRAWLLINELNVLFTQPVIQTWQGGKSKGGASLTDFGKELVTSYAVLVENANAANSTLLEAIGRHAAPARACTKTRHRSRHR